MPANNTLNITETHLDIALNQLKLGFWELDISTLTMDCTPQCKINVGAADLSEGLSYGKFIELIIPEDNRRSRLAFKMHYRLTMEKFLSIVGSSSGWQPALV